MRERKDAIVTGADQQSALIDHPFELTVTLDIAAGAFRFEWLRVESREIIATGRLLPNDGKSFWYWVLAWTFNSGIRPCHDGCNAWAASTRALAKRIRKLLPVEDSSVRVGLLSEKDLGPAQANQWFPFQMPHGLSPWKWLEREIYNFAQLTESSFGPNGEPRVSRAVNLHRIACALLQIPPSRSSQNAAAGSNSRLLDLRLTFDQQNLTAEFVWTDSVSGKIDGVGRIRCRRAGQLTWETEKDGQREASSSSYHRNSIHAVLDRWLKQFGTNGKTFNAYWTEYGEDQKNPTFKKEPPLFPGESLYLWIEDNIVEMAEASRIPAPPLIKLSGLGFAAVQADMESYGRRLQRKEEKRAEEEARRRANMERLAMEQRKRQAEARKSEKSKPSVAARTNDGPGSAVSSPPKEAPCLPPLSIRFEMQSLEFKQSASVMGDLRSFFLRERAALWWVSNQSDDLLCLPHCRIERLEYQVRTALRVLGPLRGRALLSDEVGLGKTIEAGLVIKELLTRGMAKKFLILTVPSLVDQWEEELRDKFNLETATTNHSNRNDPAKFWNEHSGIVASLHTLKQPAQLEIARQVKWDILIVDEAHYLRNRESQAWQAVNALPRQFLLLLTATPVQNSLEELYNLVTLLQPGQLPTPKEFRSRFIDPKRPRQPREPEALRHLLGQVMIRNTRANAGIKLPPRRAETVLFEAGKEEQAFWQTWESDFRQELSRLNPSQANMWGRLLLQTAGSSPAAWRKSLEKFPNPELAQVWREQSPPEASWRKKCELIPPLTRGEGGAVIFTQFLETQAALAEFLHRAGVKTFVINGSTPSPERQPISEQFRKLGGALILTRSGTEGRNLQFCRNLVNFDLPWNPMEIEQRIGRLHRLGQQHPVRIYNFVQAGTLQEHLLQILQEKLNLFELVVGETGLVLGERFGSDEFAEEVFRRWQENEGRVAEAFAGLGEELAIARDAYQEVKQLDETLFAKNYESL